MVISDETGRSQQVVIEAAESTDAENSIRKEKEGRRRVAVISDELDLFGIPIGVGEADDLQHDMFRQLRELGCA